MNYGFPHFNLSSGISGHYVLCETVTLYYCTSLQGILSPTLQVSPVLHVLCARYHCFLGNRSTPFNQSRPSQRDANKAASCDVDSVGLLNLWNFASCHIVYSVSHACTFDYRPGLEVTPLRSEKTAAANETRINHPRKFQSCRIQLTSD